MFTALVKRYHSSYVYCLLMLNLQRDLAVTFNVRECVYSSLLMPLMCKDMLELLDAGNSSSANHTSLSDYAFLYGIFPTAPSVAIYATQYNMQLEVVSFTFIHRYKGQIKQAQIP